MQFDHTHTHRERTERMEGGSRVPSASTHRKKNNHHPPIHSRLDVSHLFKQWTFSFVDCRPPSQRLFSLHWVLWLCALRCVSFFSRLCSTKNVLYINFYLYFGFSLLNVRSSNNIIMNFSWFRSVALAFFFSIFYLLCALCMYWMNIFYTTFNKKYVCANPHESFVQCPMK